MLKELKAALAALGTLFSRVVESPELPREDAAVRQFRQQIQKAIATNLWFTEENIKASLLAWSEALTLANLERWLAAYEIANDGTTDKTVGVICAGNLPLVGLHDVLCVLCAGHRLLLKLSQKDTPLMQGVIDCLKAQMPIFQNRITITDFLMKDFDAMIATGSDNTHRYFDHYFSKYPHILRKNRNSVAVLTGAETSEQLAGLCDDIFRYFGMGCRSVAKIYVPKGYDFNPLFKASLKYQDLIDHPKYKNNYDYQKSVYLLSNTPIWENGLLIIVASESYQTPIAVLGYENYDTVEAVFKALEQDKDALQCIVANADGFTDFGKAQAPHLWDYADGVDTMQFLTTL